MQNNERDDDSPDISATQQQQPLVYQPLIPEQGTVFDQLQTTVIPLYKFSFKPEDWPKWV